MKSASAQASVTDLLLAGRTMQHAADLNGWPRRWVLAIVAGQPGWSIDEHTDTLRVATGDRLEDAMRDSTLGELLARGAEGGPGGGPVPGSRVTHAEIRAWAIEHSIPVSTRGRVRAPVIAQYLAAHQQEEELLVIALKAGRDDLALLVRACLIAAGIEPVPDQAEADQFRRLADDIGDGADQLPVPPGGGGAR